MAEEVDDSTWNDFQKMCVTAGCSCSTIQRSETEATDEKPQEVQAGIAITAAGTKVWVLSQFFLFTKSHCHTSYLSFLLHNRNLRCGNFTLESA